MKASSPDPDVRSELVARPSRRRGSLLFRFRKDRRGATAIEFALVAMPFLGLLFATLETALVLWSTQVLESAVGDAARRIYTGEFQQNNTATKPADLPGKFRDEVCKGVVALFGCSAIHIDVRTYASFPSKSAPAPITADGQFDAANFDRYDAPQANQIVVVRAAVEYPIIASLMNPGQANLKNGNRLLMATAAFRTEPF